MVTSLTIMINDVDRNDDDDQCKDDDKREITKTKRQRSKGKRKKFGIQILKSVQLSGYVFDYKKKTTKVLITT